jgi:hypothetical protein
MRQPLNVKSPCFQYKICPMFYASQHDGLCLWCMLYRNSLKLKLEDTVVEFYENSCFR